MGNRKLRAVSLPPMGRRRRLIELGKDLLILFLLLSAIYLAARSQLYTGLIREDGWISKAVSLLSGETARPVDQTEFTTPAQSIQAARLAVCHGLGENGQPIRYGVQYDTAQAAADFSALSSYLSEGVASASAPQAVSREAWLQALQTPGVYFDLLGEAPLEYLGSASLTGPVRRLALVWEGGDTAVLYYKNEKSGLYYACPTSLRWAGYLEGALQDYTDNGARFAFELEDYRMLLEETLLLPETPQPGLYQVQTVLDLSEVGDRSALENALGFWGSDYQVPGEWVIREDDELRISSDGVLTYEAAAAGGLDPRYDVTGSDGEASLVQAAALACYLAQQAVDAWCGTAESAAWLYLSSVEETEDGWRITLDYCLDGATVYLGDGWPAATFTVSGGQIASFEIRPRCYVASEGTSSVLPQRQAAAALEALSPEDPRELLLFYEDGSSMAAQWGGF